MTTSSHLGTTNMPELWLPSRAFCCVCAWQCFISTTGPYVTYCVVWLSSYQGFRENQDSSGAAAAGQNAWGHAQKAALQLAGLWSALGAWMRKKLWRHKQGSRGKFLLQCEIINETMTKSQYWAWDSVLILCQLTTLCAFRTDLVINLLQTCAMWARPSRLHKDVFSCKPTGNA